MRRSQFAIVFLVVASPLAMYFMFRPHPETQEEYTARMFEIHTGIPGANLKELTHAVSDLRARKATEADVEVLEKYSISPRLELRAGSEMATGYLIGTPFQSRAHAMVLRLAEDPDPGTRLIAIESLIPFSRSEAKVYVDKNLASPDPNIAMRIRQIAKKL